MGTPIDPGWTYHPANESQFQDSIVQLNYPLTCQPCTIIAIAIMNLVATPKSTMSSDVLPSESASLNFDRLNPLRSARALQPVLQLLRSQYSSGCLTAELVQVIHDQFVVQAKVQVDGVAIVTALASASTVEVAEDRARTRVLESLGLSSTPSLSHALSNSLNSSLHQSLSATVALMPEVVMPEVVMPEVVMPEVVMPNVMMPAVVEEPAIDQPEPEAPKVTKTSTKRKGKAAAPAIETPVETPAASTEIALEIALEIGLDITPEPIAEVLTEVLTVEEPLEEVLEPVVEPIAETVVAETVVAETVVAETVVEDAPVEEEPETFEVTFDGGDVEYEYTFEEEVMPEVAPKVTEPRVTVPTIPAFTMDLSDAIAQIGSEIDRIGWTKKQGSAYLQESYGKRTRAELTETELFSFLAYLKSLPAKVQPDLSALPF